MTFLKDPLLEFIQVWYTQYTLIPQYTIFLLFKSHYLLRMNICLPFKQNRVFHLFLLHFRH